MILSLNKHKNLYYLIATLAIIRLIVSPFFDLGVDEAHYALYASHLDISYFDHPPLIGWMQWFFISIFGENNFAIRVSAILLGSVATYFLYLFIFTISKDTKISFLSTISLSGSLMFNALFLMSMPDTILFALIVPIIIYTIDIYKNPNFKSWAIFGFLLGLAGLAKYTAILFILPIVLFFIIKKQFNFFKDKNFYISIIIALVTILPVIIWNIEHDFISFTYQSDHVVGSSKINLFYLGQSLAAQFIAYNPFLVLFAFYGLYKSFKSNDDYLFLSALFGLVLIGFFTYASLYKPALPHWSALFYMIFIPLGVYFALLHHNQKLNKFINFSILFGIILSLVVYIELVFKIIPFPDYNSPHRDIYGFNIILEKANKEITNPNKEALAITNWTLASRAIYYNQKYNSDIFLIDKRYDQFDIWEKSTPKDKDILFIGTKLFTVNINSYRCSSTQKLPSFDILLNNKKVNTISMTWCKNFQGIK